MLQYFSISIIYQALLFSVGGSPSGFLFLFPLYLIGNIKSLVTRKYQPPIIAIRNYYDFALCVFFIMIFLISFLIYRMNYLPPDRLNAFVIFFFVGFLFSKGLKIHQAIYYLLFIAFIYVLSTNLFLSIYYTGAYSFSAWKDSENVLNYQSLSIALIGIYILVIQNRNNLLFISALMPFLFIGGSRSVLIAYFVAFLLYVYYTKKNQRMNLIVLGFIALIFYLVNHTSKNFIESSELRFSDTNSFFERIDLTVFHLNNSVSIVGYFAHDIVKYGEEGAYAHNILDFLFGYGIIGSITVVLILYRSIKSILKKTMTNSPVDFYDVFIFVYVVTFCNNLSAEFAYLFGKFFSETINIKYRESR